MPLAVCCRLPGRLPCRRPARPAAAADAGPALWVVQRRRHDHLPVRHLPRARRPFELVQRERSRRLRRVRRAGARNAGARGSGRASRRLARNSLARSRARRAGRLTGRAVLRRFGRPGDGGRARAWACRSTMAPTPCCAAPPMPAASRSRASKASNSSCACSAACRRPPRRPRERAGDARRGIDGLSTSMGEHAGGLEARRQGRLRRHARQCPRRARRDTYKTMFTDRNASWADWIAERMRSPARSSSPSAPAISSARTASSAQPRRSRGIASGPHYPDRLRQTCLVAGASLGARIPGHGHPWRRGGAI